MTRSPNGEEHFGGDSVDVLFLDALLGRAGAGRIPVSRAATPSLVLAPFASIEVAHVEAARGFALNERASVPSTSRVARGARSRCGAGTRSTQCSGLVSKWESPEMYAQADCCGEARLVSRLLSRVNG